MECGGRKEPARGERTSLGMPAASTRFKPHRVHVRAPISRIQWDRKFRALLLAVLALIGWIGVHGVITLIHTHDQAEHELQLVSSLVAANHQLEARQAALGQRQTIIRDARALGMVQAHEQAYVVTGLSGN
jgi:cell division protein FtsB